MCLSRYMLCLLVPIHALGVANGLGLSRLDRGNGHGLPAGFKPLVNLLKSPRCGIDAVIVFS
jgi:hypothetical protein